MKKIAEVLKESKRILILMHERPDGDALGSSFALRLALISMGKACDVLLDEPIPSHFYHFPVEAVSEPDGDYDTVIALDCGDQSRFERNARVFDEAPLTVEIDHHVNNPHYADYSYVRICAATAELVYELMEALGVIFTKDMATWLYIGLSTDTGGFRFSNTTASTHQKVAKLLETGISQADINRVLYDTNSLTALKLQGKLIETLSFIPEKKCAYGYLDYETLTKHSADTSHTDGLARIPVSLEGAELGIFVTEFQKGEMKVSLRSSENIDVQKIASRFGGGGHVRASGCKLKADTPLDAINEIISALDE